MNDRASNTPDLAKLAIDGSVVPVRALITDPTLIVADEPTGDLGQS
jgi:ABC-type ATPase involved in cell division